MFGLSHVSSLAVTAIAAVFLIKTSIKSTHDAVKKGIGYFIVFLILGGLSLMVLYKYFAGTFSVHTDLPMQLCDWAGLMVAATILWGNTVTFEMAYFWVLSGSTQALATPDIVENFPSVEFLYFFMVHSGEIIGIFFLIFVLNMYPRKWSVIRVFLLTNAYLMAAVLVNYITASNYGYVMHKPPEGSLIDFLGPWPYYILSLEGVALISYTLCYSPYFFRSMRDKRRWGP